MKLNYLFYAILLSSSLNYAQTEKTDIYSNNISYDLAEVNHNLNTGIESFDIESCHYNAREAHKLITRVYNSLNRGQCTKAIDLVYEIKAEIEAALRNDEHVHGKMYLGKAQKLINNTFYEYDLCATSSSGDEALTELELRQQQLKQQQLDLERERLEIQTRLAQQKEEEQIIKKKRFIGANLNAFENTIKAYNQMLEACNCGLKIENTPFDSQKLTDKSLDQIKVHFLEKIKLATNDYMATLDDCDD